jgi:RHS repeat-associated protein
MGANGNLIARYLYNPFGKVTGQWGALAEANRYRFSSKEVHSLSGLSYYGGRFYEPNLQRWLNRDPMGEAGGMNLYGFAGNGPTLFVDSDGLGFADVVRAVNGVGDKLARAIDPLGAQTHDQLTQAMDDLRGALNQAATEVGQGLYDSMMGDQPGQYDQNTMGAQRAALLGGIDRDNNVLRDSMGLGSALTADAAETAAEMYVGNKLMGLGGGRCCPIKRPPPKSGLPELRISASKYPQLAENIRHAQNAGHPDVLTHGGKAVIDANRNAALHQPYRDFVLNIGGGLTRDEYPFASSLEGGAGSWVGHIPESQQNAQGALIRNFINANNIVPSTQYRVVIVP